MQGRSGQIPRNSDVFVLEGVLGEVFVVGTHDFGFSELLFGILRAFNLAKGDRIVRIGEHAAACQQQYRADGG
jgi:hypothetical protein